MIKFVDWAAGIGGMRLGLENASSEFNCVASCEIDKYARIIYKNNFGCEPEWKDSYEVDVRELPEFDLLCTGFPCQAFSVAGKREGFSDSRGAFFFELARIIENKRPSYLLFENVKGLLSNDNGRTFTKIIKTLDELGYDCQWQVLNSKCFGVPQNRERVYIIGHSRKVTRPKVFPIGEIYGVGEKAIEKGREIQNYTTAIDANYWKGCDKHGERSVVALTECRTEEAKEIRRSTKGKDWCPRRAKEIVPREDGLSNTITAGFSIEQLLLDGKLKLRRLTPLECERLQGFPDDWTQGVSDTQRYKCLGNAVTVNVVTEIGKKLVGR